MIAYKNTSQGFILDVETNKISTKIKDAVIKSFGWKKVSLNEEGAWTNSMQFMGNVIRRSGIAPDCGILIEYNLPSTSLRVDFIISGHDENSKPSFIIIELKQWKEATSTQKDGIVYTTYHGEDPHPSYQAYSYKLFLKDFNENIYNSNFQALSCAYLHNYVEKNPEPLREKIYSSIVKDSPLYFKDDQLQLEEFIRIYIGKGKGGQILYQIENGNIRPSKKLIDHVAGLFKGNKEFVLLEKQKVAFETAKDLAINSKDKTVLIINGGPGTGKSVISMNLLGDLLKESKNALFVAPNSSFRNVMVNTLTKSVDPDRIKYLLKGSGSFYGARKNSFDVLIVDEAHRLKNETAYMYQGKNQIEDIVNAAKVGIFFIDEKQVIRPEDIGTVDGITRIAEKHNAKIHKLNLTAQFRCAGADGYVNWVEDVLQLEATGNFDGWDHQAFEFKICNNPNQLRQLIEEKNLQGFKSRMLAGFAWIWSQANKGNANAEIADVTIPEFDFRMPWNSRRLTTWAIEEDGVNQIGCVHTSQGLEFDYVGVIIGNDLKFNLKDNRYYTEWNDYKDSKGKQGMRYSPNDLNKLVRNIYRILLTRGMKGCYVYFMDKEVENYFRSRIGI